jgi:hypothetical protein
MGPVQEARSQHWDALLLVPLHQPASRAVCATLMQYRWASFVQCLVFDLFTLVPGLGDCISLLHHHFCWILYVQANEWYETL